MSRLADLFPFGLLSAGRLLDHLADTHPKMTEWSRSAQLGALPPRTLARLILAALPAAFAVGVEELCISDQAVRAKNGSVQISNRPSIEILDVDGLPRWVIAFEVEITLERPARVSAGSTAEIAPTEPWDAYITMHIRGEDPEQSIQLLTVQRSIATGTDFARLKRT